MSELDKIEDTREGQVERQIQRHSNLATELMEVVNKAEDRLSSILRGPAKGEPSADKEEETLVPMAVQINAGNDVIQESIINLRGLLGRLEL